MAEQETKERAAYAPNNGAVPQEWLDELVSDEQARQSYRRLVNSHFGNNDKAQISIPVSKLDDDIVLYRFMHQRGAGTGHFSISFDEWLKQQYFQAQPNSRQLELMRVAFRAGALCCRPFTNQRLFDLVRYERASLHNANLISDDEYALLAEEHSAAQRLETYDGLMNKATSLRLMIDEMNIEEIGTLMGDQIKVGDSVLPKIAPFIRSLVNAQAVQKQQLYEASVEVRTIKRDFDVLLSTHQTMTERVAGLASKLADTEKELADRVARVGVLEANLSGATTNIVELQNQLGDLRESAGSYKKNFERNLEQLTKVTAERDGYQERLQTNVDDMGKDEHHYRTICSTKIDRQSGRLGIKILATEDSQRLSPASLSKLSDLLDDAVLLIRTDEVRLSPGFQEEIDRLRGQMASLFSGQHIYMEQIPNAYWGKEPYGLTSPWFIVTTFRGRIRVGWRKRVIEIDWSDSGVTAKAEELIADQVTKDGRLVHAYGYDKAREYISKILSAK